MICRPSIGKPVIQLMQRLASVARAENCGVWYRRILGRLDAINCVATCSGLTSIISTTVNVVGGTIREASYDAVQTILRNTGANAAFIYEDDSLIYQLAAGEEWIMPVAGKLKLEAEAVSGTTSITVTTFLRCDCGVIETVVQPSEEQGGILV